MSYGFSSGRMARSNKVDFCIHCQTDSKNYDVWNEQTKQRVSTHKTYSDAKDALDKLRIEALTESAKTSKRRVYPTYEIPHLWAHQIVPEARNQAGNLYFDGNTIYSYGSHFPIARHVTGKAKGSHAILFTTQRYSVTTSKHCSEVHSAIPSSIKVFEVRHIEDSEWFKHDKNLAAYAEHITKTMQSLARARKAYSKDSAAKAIASDIAEAKAYAKFFGLPAPKLPKLPKDWTAYAHKLNSDAAKERAEHRKAEKLAEQRYLLEQAENIEDWRKGKANGHLYDIPTMLRINGNEMETSRGARVPLADALRALAFVQRVRESGIEYKTNGHTFHIGHYTIDRVTKDGTIYAGCHVIEWSEVERIIPQLEAIEASK